MRKYATWLYDYAIQFGDSLFEVDNFLFLQSWVAISELAP